MDKILAIYKPKGFSSNQILQEIKKISGEKKIGHAGTLDPLARGVLVVGIGRKATKKLKEIVGQEKEYIAKIKLGWESTTDDKEGEKKKTRVLKIPSLEEIKNVLQSFQGKIFQIPPLFSAVKIKGKEAYKLARKGEVFSLKPRKVEIKKIRILNYKWPYLKIKVVTGPGVYIRALARDLGRKLGTGGYLAELERIRVGNFSKEKTFKISQLKMKFSTG